MQIPNDPFILFSYINTQLRDSGLTLEDFCAEHALDARTIIERLAKAGFRYDAAQRRFR
ncbi:MAG: DUF4250 domain-containing protein [Oscillospiraceae bacterium]|nr:DUF4250 domain-containing protein [Oscillospiraceae bacterium]